MSNKYDGIEKAAMSILSEVTRLSEEEGACYTTFSDNALPHELDHRSINSRILQALKDEIKCGNEQTTLATKNLDNRIAETNKANLRVTSKERKMPTQFADGSFTYNFRKSGLMRYQFICNGERKAVYGYTKNECYKKREDYIAGKVIKGSKLRLVPTLADWLKDWAEAYKKPYVSEQQLKNIHRYSSHLCTKFGKTPLNKLDPIEMQKFINTFSDRPKTQKDLWNVLKSSLIHAVENRIIKFNPVPRINIMPHKAKPKRALEIHEQQRIFDHILPEYKKLFMFACCTGIRIGRALELTHDDLNYDLQVITVIRKQRRGLNEVYRVPFLPRLIQECCSKSGKLFNIDYKAASKYFRDVYKRLGIENANIHSFRHTFGSVLYFLKVDLKRIQELMGHSTFEMTSNVYTHLIKRDGTSIVLDYLKELKRKMKL